MALPLVPFAAGMAVGALVTFGYKDKQVHEQVVDGARQLYGSAMSGLAWLLGHRPGKEPRIEAPQAKAARKTPTRRRKTTTAATA